VGRSTCGAVDNSGATLSGLSRGGCDEALDGTADGRSSVLPASPNRALLTDGRDSADTGAEELLGTPTEERSADLGGTPWVSTLESPLLPLLGGFLFTFVMTRGVTCLIRAGRSVFSDVSVGALHLHHMVWGAGLVLVSGTFEFAFTPAWPWSVLPAMGFGVGAALMLDEFALMVYLRDVYWSNEGRRSIDAVITMMVVVGMLAIPFTVAPRLLPPGIRPFFFALAVSYIVVMAIVLMKGKIFSGLVGLFLPPVLLVAATRLARPGSPWALVVYRNSGTKKVRAAARFRPTAVHERYRRRVLDLIGGTLPRLATRGLASGGIPEDEIATAFGAPTASERSA
jgi:hypothetical protein